MLDVYAKFAALLSVKCQGCGQLFRVGVSWSFAQAVHEGLDTITWNAQGQDGKPKFMPDKDGPGEFYFGDAPWHAEGKCRGVTMTTIAVCIIEFWQRSDQPGELNFMEWVRRGEYEYSWFNLQAPR
jgi:hypothetical protein